MLSRPSPRGSDPEQARLGQDTRSVVAHTTNEMKARPTGSPGIESVHIPYDVAPGALDAESPSKRIATPTAAKVEKKRRFAESLLVLMAADWEKWIGP